jgi:thiamine biosynthesis protein ThiS
VTVNGQAVEISPKESLHDLLERLDEPHAAAVVVRNHRFVHKDDVPKTQLEDGDTLEVILPAFGG